MRERLVHVRWIDGGTGAGKSAVAGELARRFDADSYDGDSAERGYLARVRPDRQPRLAALIRMTLAQRWLDRSPGQIFADMPSLNGETFPFVLDDICARPAGTVLLVDDFRTLPRDVAPLLSWPGQAVFLLPTTAFRERALGSRYADRPRRLINWGDSDPEQMLEARLARDELWDAEVLRQAKLLGLPALTVDGSRSPHDMADELESLFCLRSS